MINLLVQIPHQSFWIQETFLSRRNANHSYWKPKCTLTIFSWHRKTIAKKMHVCFILQKFKVSLIPCFSKKVAQQSSVSSLLSTACIDRLSLFRSQIAPPAKKHSWRGPRCHCECYEPSAISVCDRAFAPPQCKPLRIQANQRSTAAQYIYANYYYYYYCDAIFRWYLKNHWAFPSDRHIFEEAA